MKQNERIKVPTTIDEAIAALNDAFAKVINGDISPDAASSAAGLANAAMRGSVVKLTYAKMKAEVPQIPYLEPTRSEANGEQQHVKIVN